MGDKRNIQIKVLIDRITQPSIEISDVNLTILSKYLSEISVGNILEAEYFITWLKHVVQQWNTTKQKYSLNAVLLISDIIALKCADEQTFLNLNLDGLLDDVFKIIRSVPEIQTTPRFHHFLRLTGTFLKHKSGTQWIIATNVWYEVLTSTLKTNDKQIIKAGCEFLAELVARTKHDNDIFCNSVLKLIVAPLYIFQKSVLQEDNSMAVDKENSNKKIVKQLEILETFLSKMLSKCCSENDFKVISTLQDKFRIDDFLKILAKQITDDELHFQLNKILSLVYYFIFAKELKMDASSEKIAKINFYSAKIHDVIRDEALSTQDYSKVLKLVHLDHVYFSSIVKNLTCANIATTEFQYQMLGFLFVPISHALSHSLGMKKFGVGAAQSDQREHFANKVIRKLLPLTFQTLARIQYSPKCYKIEDAIAVFQHIQECCRFYDTSVVHTIAEAMVYTFSDTIEFLHHNHKMIQHIPQDFMLGILETCIYLFSEFNITWKDILETIFLVEVVAKCIALPYLSTRVLAKALQFFALAIRKDFHSHLALLADTVDDDSVRVFGVFMNKQINHSSWEVRNESIRVLQECVKKYATYRDECAREQIIENDYLSLILRRCRTDSEISVRITALRFMQDVVAVKEFWEYLQRVDNLHDQIMQMYYLEPDGILRGEAIALITTVYENHELPEIFLQKLYDVMTYAIFEDEFPLLKTNALIFWQKVIEQHLKSEGMLDGEFPEATFSKDLKKIITFDEFQIRKCLYTVLCKLSKIGCLTALLYALNSHPNEELAQVALDISKPFLLLYRKYFYSSPTCKESQKSTLITTHTESISSETITIPGSPHRTALSLSPSPESLYDDILDLQESLEADCGFFQPLFENFDAESPEVVQRTEFLRFVENIDFSVYNKPNNKYEEIDGVLNSILNS